MSAIHTTAVPSRRRWHRLLAFPLVLGLLLAEDIGGPDVDRRRVDVLLETVDDLPGSPEVTGIEDNDGDGLDDDGRLQAQVDDEVACIAVDDSGDTDVDSGPCA